MSNWWVNIGAQTEAQIKGGYLWSPKTTLNDRINQFYLNMALVEPGDSIFAYYERQIQAVGIASNRAVDFKRPFGPGNVPADTVGWLVTLDWIMLKPALRPSEHLGEIVPRLPKEYAPIRANGLGNQVYLSRISADLAATLLKLANQRIELPELVGIADNSFVVAKENALEAVIEKNTGIHATESIALIQARRGQGKFKTNVGKIESKGCRITGVTDARLLMASHIKPWRLCETNDERLDGHNGLLFTPTFNVLFRQGYLSFENDGTVLLSEHFPLDQLKLVGLPNAVTASPFKKEHWKYLEFHREEIFR